jgi:succinate dehydrogenase/fumarate reductase flavoprotein subunit
MVQTVAAWNRYVTAGADPDFEREKEGPMHPIAKPPFYALAILVTWHDSYGGLRVNGRQQVIDMQGQVIPGLYAGGEARGRVRQARPWGTVQGYIAGTSAA